GTTTPTAGRLARTRALRVPRPIPNQRRSGVAANSSGVTCGPLEVSTARYATDAPPSTRATFGFQRPFTDGTLLPSELSPKGQGVVVKRASGPTRRPPRARSATPRPVPAQALARCIRPA